MGNIRRDLDPTEAESRAKSVCADLKVDMCHVSWLAARGGKTSMVEFTILNVNCNVFKLRLRSSRVQFPDCQGWLWIDVAQTREELKLSLIHISEPTRH
eukprot:3570959-Karenia_brevis.AAC.1